MEEAILLSSVAELARMIRSREISPVELTAAYIDRTKRLDTQLLAVVTLTEELAIQQARAAGSGNHEWPLPWAAARNPVGRKGSVCHRRDTDAMGFARI